MLKNFFSSNMSKSIEAIIKECHSCILSKNPKIYRAPLVIIEPIVTFHTCVMDFIGPLKETDYGNKYILMAVDQFQKWPEAWPCKIANTDAVINVIMDTSCRFGPPFRVHTDQGTQFMAH